FYRANNYRQVISGMGIGLYISAEIVQRSGGKIWVDSTEGVGSTFYVALPLTKAAGNHKEDIHTHEKENFNSR
ncbi:MAG: sensor histidine kinase, partial [Agriterribacter sp.]